ncbi:MAG: hypothetical protein AB1640_16505 [bacterium]
MATVMTTHEFWKGRGNARTDVQQMQVRAAERLTILSLLRTGAVALALPVCVLVILTLTANDYDAAKEFGLLLPLLVGCGGLALGGLYMVLEAVVSLQRLDRRSADANPASLKKERLLFAVPDPESGFFHLPSLPSRERTSIC